MTYESATGRPHSVTQGAGTVGTVTTTRAPRLVLWDIDHTLVDLSKAGGDWYTTALATVTGATLRHRPIFGGRTERAITMEILASHDIEVTEETIQRLWRELIDVSERALPTLSQGGRALPGAADALSTMAGLGGIVQTLVTGNLPEISRHKLSAFGLHTHVDFEIGGYGSLSAHRPDLVAHAVGLASAKHGTVFAPDSVVIIGDTPLDVDAALRHGAVAVGVAAELQAAGAHTVLTDLSDTAAVHAAVLGL
jgi:phosphoglycolate phosphatase-like HAD superfamily hydrolase